MKQCGQTRTTHAWLDSRLDETARRRHAAHVAACPHCSALQADVLRQRELLQAMPPPPPLDVNRVWNGVAAAIAAAPQQRAGRMGQAIPFARPLLAWAAGLLLVAGVATTSWLSQSGHVDAPAGTASRVDWVETGMDGAGTMVYCDAQSDLVVIWVTGGERE